MSQDLTELVEHPMFAALGAVQATRQLVGSRRR